MYQEAEGAWGPDESYRCWFDEMLSATAPHGGVFPVVNEYEYVVAAYKGLEETRLPPPQQHRL
jgi:hypothetical protein